MNISFGAQIGAEGKIAGNNIGGHINLINAELLSFKEELFGQGDKGTGASWNYLNKDGLVKVTQSVELAAEVINIGAEKSFEQSSKGTSNHEDKWSVGASAAPVGLPLGVKYENSSKGRNSVHTETGIDIRFGIGVKIDYKIGLQKN